MISKKITITIVLLTIITIFIVSLYIFKNSNEQMPIIKDNEQTQEDNIDTKQIDKKEKLADEGYDLIEFDDHIIENSEEIENEHDTSINEKESHLVNSEEITVTKEGEIEIKIDQGNNSTEIIYDIKDTTE